MANAKRMIWTETGPDRAGPETTDGKLETRTLRKVIVERGDTRDRVDATLNGGTESYADENGNLVEITTEPDGTTVSVHCETLQAYDGGPDREAALEYVRKNGLKKNPSTRSVAVRKEGVPSLAA